MPAGDDDPGQDVTTQRRSDGRARTAWAIAGLGSVLLGAALAAAAAVGGAGGRSGLAAFLLGAFLCTGIGSLFAVLSGAWDTYHGRHVGRSRVVAAVVLGFIAVFVIPPMLIGLAG